MGRKRRSYSPEFQKEAVELVRSSGKSANRIAADLGVSQASLSRWIRLASSSREGSDIFDHNEELRRLRKKVELLEKEREILKKAAVFFAKESQ
jgi:transposase